MEAADGRATRRILTLDAKLDAPTAAGRTIRTVAEELRARGFER